MSSGADIPSGETPSDANGSSNGGGSVLNSPKSTVLLPELKRRNPSYVGDPTTAVDMGNVSTVSMGSANLSPTFTVAPSRRNIPRSILSDQDSDVASELQLGHGSQRERESTPDVEHANTNDNNVDDNDADYEDEDDEEDLHHILTI